ncbi:peptidase [Enemella dayhoffiae]|uniref:Peptidase n=1 Tax=Enemella dayhoffiae TaxID=2016507 RepID=A0A255H0F1_9ACTN|nr:peptidoglycan-binding protein [Enemella dayhoffiae]OYO20806.1 peptidase [Enemella dayhoffiae]
MSTAVTRQRRIKRPVAIAAGVLALTIAGGVGVAVDQAVAAPSQISASDTDAYPVLREGAGGQRVRILQHLLSAHGIATSVDGSFGPGTERSVRTFQSRRGITVDGTVGPQTWSRILVVAREGNRGPAVKAIQETLNANGARLQVDGSFGPATKKAVISFQDAKNLDSDGVVGPNTWGALLGVKGGSTTPTPPPSTGTGSPGPDTRYPNPKRTYANGNVPSSQLCRVPGARSDAWRMSCRAVPDFKAMNAAYKKQFGMDLEVDHLTLTAYRTVADQRLLYNKYGPGRAAKPGTSNHGWGMALDINMRRGGAGSHQSATYKWLHANGPKYGFRDTVPHEDWHFDYQR